MFVQVSLDMTCHATECGVTTCPGYEESCHSDLSQNFSNGSPKFGENSISIGDTIFQQCFTLPR